MMKSAPVLVLVLAVFATLILGSFLHAVIPHEHEHQSVWSTLHAALRHEEKIALISSFFSVCVALVALYVVQRAIVPSSIFFDSLQLALRRGQVTYRKFK